MFGYLLVVPKNTSFLPSCQNEVEILYETDDAIHVKNDRMRELDREIGDIKMEIIDIETNAMLKFVYFLNFYNKFLDDVQSKNKDLKLIIFYFLSEFKQINPQI